METPPYTCPSKVEGPILNHAQFLTMKIFQYKIFTFQYILGVPVSAPGLELLFCRLPLCSACKRAEIPSNKEAVNCILSGTSTVIAEKILFHRICTQVR